MLLKNCRYVVTQNSKREILEHVDVLIEGDTIKQIGTHLAGTPVIDASSHIVMPGLVNTHTHYGMQLLRGVCDDEQLHDWLRIVIPKEKALDAAQLKESAELACREMLLAGITTFADMYAPMEPLLSVLEHYPLRAVLFPVAQDLLPHGGYTVDQILSLHKTLQSNLAAGKGRENAAGKGVGLSKGATGKGTKGTGDSEVSSRVRVGIGAHSIYGCSEKQLKEVIAASTKYGLLKSLHIAETRKERFDIQEKFGKLPVEYLESIGFLDERTVLVHAIWLTKGEIRLLKKHHVSVSHCPVSNMKLASGGVMPLPEMVAEGVTVGLGSDSVVSNNTLDLFQEMKVAGLLHKHHRWDATCAPVQQLVDMATVHGAKALGMGSEIGSLEIGKRADIVLIDIDKPHLSPINNVLSTIVYSVRASDVSDVILDGKHVVKQGNLVDVKAVVD